MISARMWTQEDFARAISMSLSIVNKWCNGAKPIPQSKHSLITKALGLPGDALSTNTIMHHLASDTALRINTARVQAGFSRKDLADILEVPVDTIKTWELGNADPNDFYLLEIAANCNADLDWLLFNRDDIEPKRRSITTSRKKQALPVASARGLKYEPDR
ncbi:helix-turn-helix domain-containing protein, partial [Planctomycetota bacterium]